MQYISIDAKMTSNTLDAQCLTICLYTNNNNMFYAEFIDCFPNRINENEYLSDYIVPKLKYISMDDIFNFWEDTSNDEYNKIIYNDNENNSLHVTGTTFYIFRMMKEWLDNLKNDKIVFIVDHEYSIFSYILTHLKKYNTNFDNIYISSAIIDINILIAILGKINVDESILYVDRDDIIKDNGIMLSGNNTSIAIAIRNMNIFELIRKNFNF